MMEKTHCYKSWLSTYESAVYCGNDYDEAHKLLNSVITTIMETGFCSMLDLIDFDCDICRNRVRPVSYSGVHGWTEDQLHRMCVAVDTLGYYAWLGQPVNLNDKTEEEKEMKVAKAVQQPEQPRKCCADCKYFRALLTQQPCLNCLDHSEFVPAQNKGEREMKLNVIDPHSITPKRIWFNEHDGKCFTTVEWEDGVKTTVSETLNATDYGGFTAALAKRIYGTGGTIRMMNQAIDKANEKKKLREEQRKQDRLLKQYRREYEATLRKKMHEERVREEVERLRAEREAKRRILGDHLGAFAKALSMFDCGLDKKEDHAE